MIHIHKYKPKSLRAVKKSDCDGREWMTRNFLYFCSVCDRPKVIEKHGNWSGVEL